MRVVEGRQHTRTASSSRPILHTQTRDTRPLSLLRQGVLELRAKAREFALKTIDAQRQQFKRYGVWADWAAPYVTLEPAYEAAQLQVFGKMYTNGHIYR